MRSLLRSRFRAARARYYSASHAKHLFSIISVALLILSIPSALAAQFTPMTSTLVGTTAGHADGSGTSAKFAATPHGVTLSPSGTFAMVSDTANNAIRRIDVESRAVTTLTSTTVGYINGVGTNARFASPTAMCMADYGQLAYVFDTSRSLRQIDIAGTRSAGGALTVTRVVGGTVAEAGESRTGASTRQDGNFYASPYFGNANYLPSDCVATASGSYVYLVEGGGSAHRVRYVNVNTRATVTIAGTNIPNYPANQKGYQDGIGTNAVFFFPTASALVSTATGLLLLDTSGWVDEHKCATAEPPHLCSTSHDPPSPLPSLTPGFSCNSPVGYSLAGVLLVAMRRLSRPAPTSRATIRSRPTARGSRSPRARVASSSTLMLSSRARLLATWHPSSSLV